MLTPDNLKKDEPMTHEQIHDYLVGLGFEYSEGNNYPKTTLPWKHLYQFKKNTDKQILLYSNNEFDSLLPREKIHTNFDSAFYHWSEIKAKLDKIFKKETTMQQPTWEIFDDKGSKTGSYFCALNAEYNYESTQKSLEAHLNKKVIGWTTYAEFGKMEQPDPTKFEWVGEMMSYKDFTILCEDESVYKAKLVKPAEPKFKTEDLVFYKNKIWYVTGFDGKCYSLKDKNGYGDIALADDIKAVTFEEWCKEHLPPDRINIEPLPKGDTYYHICGNHGKLGYIYKDWPLDKQIAIAQAYIDAVESEKE